MTISAVPYVVPTGGAIVLDFNLDGVVTVGSPMTISRATSTDGVLSGFTTLYSGDAASPFIDVGDALPQPLTAGTAYVYEITDPTGTVQTAPLQPGGALVIEDDGVTRLLIRLLQAGITNLTLPARLQSPGVLNQGRPIVSNAMPITGFPPLPFIVVNQDLVQQENVPIGQNVVQPNADNLWTQSSYAKKIWRVSVLTRTPDERDFYRDSLIAIFQSLLGSVFARIGANMSHRYQAASGQTSDEYQGKSPGFYFADVMLEVLGTFNFTIATSFGRIDAIETNAVLPDGQVDHALTGSPV